MKAFPQKLPYEQFLDSFKYVPRPAVNLLVVRDDGAILLTKRKKPPFAGSWHLPGSFVLKSEALMDCVERVAKEELGVRVTRAELVEAFDDLTGDPRGHVVDLVYKCRLSKGVTLSKTKVTPLQELKAVGDTAEVKFFQKLPDNIGFNHRETLERLGY